MISFLRKDFTCFFLKNSSSRCKSSVFVSISLHFYSTSKPKQPVASPKHRFSSETASQAASVISSPKNLKNSDSILSFLKESGFSNRQIVKIWKYRPVTSLNLEKSAKLKIKILQDLGLSTKDIANVMANNPSILYRSANNRVIPSLSALKDLLGSKEEVAMLVRRSGWFLVNDLEKTLVPNIEFLKKSCLVPLEQIIKCMHSFPRFLLQNPENIRKGAAKAEEMGVKRGSKMFIHGVRVIVSMSDESWKLKLQAFRSLGFSEDDILRAFKKSPPSFGVSVTKMNMVKEAVVSSGKYDMSCIIKNPGSLMWSNEKRYKPRLHVLGVLESKNLIRKWPSLTTMLGMSNDEFFGKFVGPYLDEVGKVFMVKSSKREVTSS